MKAIVLTCDRFLPFANHMMRTYRAIWPDNPFTFRLPYQSFPDDLKDEHGDKVELIQSPLPIKATVLKLVEDLPDDEWVYWCIDDKYLIKLDRDEAENVLAWLPEIGDRTLCGVSFYGCRQNHLNMNDQIENDRGQVFLCRRGHEHIYNGIWIHQFLRVRALREFMGILPNDYLPVQWEEFLETVADPRICTPSRRIYVLGRSAVVFGESTVQGKITRNCLGSFREYGLPAPPFKRSKKTRIWRGKKFYDVTEKDLTSPGTVI